ncbi:MAG TPA: hypothetical protein VKH41_11740 [Myxococcota bacterium]|nr:hypothetical protein [Myxococcota bacterium]
MRKLGVLIAVAAAAVACGETRETAGAATEKSQTFSDAAGELADDVAEDVGAAGDEAADAADDATDAARKDASGAAAAPEEGIKTE